MDLEPLVPPVEAVAPPLLYHVVHQKVNLEIDFRREIRGSTELTIYPETKDLKVIKLHSRQCRIFGVTTNGLKPARVTFEDPCHQLSLHTEAGVHQHHILSSKLRGSFSNPPFEDLTIELPQRLKLEPVNLTEVHQTGSTIKISKNDDTAAESAEATQGLADTTVATFTPITVVILFSTIHVRDALHFVSGLPGSGKWPHVYTLGGHGPGKTSCLFPCLDTLYSRHTWDISLRTVRTVGAAIRQATQDSSASETTKADLAYQEREMVIVCTGDVTDEIIDKADPAKKTVSFSCSNPLSAQQIGFAIGPFEKVNLAQFRDAQEAEELGKNAVETLGYCLPGRVEEVKNTCFPTPSAIDQFVKKYIPCPYSRFSMVFVEDLPMQPSTFAEVTMCSTRMLYPEDVIDTAKDVTRLLVHAIASQWMGMNVIPEEPRDWWVIIGASHYMTESFMKELCGNNEYRFRMKRQSERIVELDQERPSIYELGALLHVDPSEYEFMSLKCPVVFFILDRRMAKVTGLTRMAAILGKILTRARMDELKNNTLSTETFQKQVEKFFHQRIDDFIEQWVKGSGCPRFQVTQRFNKKKLVVEMLIRQVHGNLVEKDLDIKSFLRDAREDFHDVWAPELQRVFTGPMTIRIHEADGTPYEHIVDIKGETTSVDIPYNTKYKRLKRTKKQKSRAANKTQEGGDDENDALLYCLGDVLQNEEDISTWRLTEWSAAEEEKMNAESFEWIRIDADFEWIATISLMMPGYMFASQLQQDRDVAAQLDSIHAMQNYSVNPLVSTILLRTMMDSRYFHGIRAAAAQAIVRHVSRETDMVGLFHLKKSFEVLYCTSENGSVMTRPNDFSNQLNYLLQEALIDAISKIRDEKGITPNDVKEFLIDKLKFNDNSANDYSDAFYVAKLIKALTSALIARPQAPRDSEDLDLWAEYELAQRFEKLSLAEIDRYRRMDEWTSSFQNLYSRTALDCQAQLAAVGIGGTSPLHFLQYTRPGNYDSLRLTAYDILTRARLFDQHGILRYILHSLVADPSPYIRVNLREMLGKALARKAVGDKKPSVNHETQELVIEDVNLESRKEDDLRRQTIDGAMLALKAELKDDLKLQRMIWDAICYPETGYEDVKTLLEFCRLLYDTKDEARVLLHYPRYWRMQNLGQGKLKFSQTTRIRRHTQSKWRPNAPAPARPVKLTFKARQQSVTATPTPPPPAPLSRQPSISQPGRIVLKLKK